MNDLKRILIPAFSLSLTFASVCGADTSSTSNEYKNIPTYLKGLESASTDDQKIEWNKKIHDAVAQANLSSQRVVKALTPLIEKIRMAMDSGLDRPYISGQVMWLASAVDYFEHEKGRQVVEVARSDWGASQTEVANGIRLIIYPNKIFYVENGKNSVVVESTQIHEAVLSPDGRRIAYYRTASESENPSEIWITSTQKPRPKKLADVASCSTLLFSIDGKSLYFQKKDENAQNGVEVHSLSATGGKSKNLTKAIALESIVSKGPYKGSLVVFKPTKHHLGAEQSCAFIVRAKDGREIGRIKDGPCH